MTTLMDRPDTEFDQARYDEGRFDGVIEKMDRTGDTKTMWDKNNPTEVAVARAAFDAAKKAGAMIYKAVGKKGKPDGETLKEFDPSIERMVIVPQLVGG